MTIPWLFLGGLILGFTVCQSVTRGNLRWRWALLLIAAGFVGLNSISAALS